MAETTGDLTLHHLRRLDEKLDRVIDVLVDHGRRLTSLEGQSAALQSGVALLHGDFAGQSLRIDRIEQRLERIETRFDPMSQP